MSEMVIGPTTNKMIKLSHHVVDGDPCIHPLLFARNHLCMGLHKHELEIHWNVNPKVIHDRHLLAAKKNKTSQHAVKNLNLMNIDLHIEIVPKLKKC